MAELSIRLLGPFQVTLKGELVTGFETEKAQALLAYLAVEAGRPHRRACLAEMLWPDRPNLRHTLAGLRRAIGDPQAAPPFLLATRQTIQFNAASDAWVDTAAFLEFLEPAAVGQLEAAVALYRGAFLEDRSIGDSATFHEWVLLTRAAVVLPDRAGCLERLQALTGRARMGRVDLEQSFLFEQYTHVLRALADQHPLLLALDDAQWADNASIGLLFHLGRRYGAVNRRSEAETAFSAAREFVEELAGTLPDQALKDNF